MTIDVKERLITARTALVLDHIFFGSLSLKLKMVESTGQTETMATDGQSLFYSPKFVEQCSDAELVGLWGHEVMHPAMQHHTRRGTRDPKLWNQAADYAINPILVDAGLSLPKGGLLNDGYKGMSAEQIYDILKQQQPPSGGGGKGKGEDQGAGAGDQDGDGQSDQQGEGASETPGGVLDSPDPVQDEAEWKVNVNQATMIAQKMGRLPGSIAEAVKRANKPTSDWRSHLRRFAQQCAAADYSWKMPNRRYLNAGIYLPELRSETMPPLVAIIDTSASTRPFQDGFVKEIESIMDECAPECLYVIEIDAKVHRVTRVERGESIVLDDLRGQGGTDFRPAFEHIEREQLQPACAIYLTDGDGRFPDPAPDYPVLWAMTSEHARAPFGETIVVE